MKLLFDENLSFRLVSLLSSIYPESIHVRDLGLVGATDEEIWSHARQYGYVLVSKDTNSYDDKAACNDLTGISIWRMVGRVAKRHPMVRR